MTAVLVAAGSSTRMGFDKLSFDLGGETVLERSVRAFDECPEVDELVIVTGASSENAQRAAARCKKPVRLVKGGSAALYCHRYVRDNVMRTDTLGSDNQVQSTLIRVPDSKVYAWNAGDSTAYQGKAGDFTDDAAAMLPTYEDVLADEVQLTAAGRQDINGEPCIAVTFEQDGYRCVYAVSTVSGLLAQASFYDGDTLTRKVTVSELSTETPDSELFTLPDGESVI